MTIESHGMKFVVDTKDLAKGFRDYGAAVDGVFAKLDAFEDHVAKTMKGIAKAASGTEVKKFAKAFDGLSSINIDAKAARKMSELSSAMSSFKAPSASQVANTKKFFTALGSLPDLSSAYRSIKNISGLSASLKGFQAPSTAQAKRLKDFASAVQSAAPAFASLRNVSGISGVANELATISLALKGLNVPSRSQITNLGNMALALRAFNFSNLQGATGLYSFLATLGRFKAPTGGQIKNLQTFINAVSNLQIPRNGAQIANVLGQIATAAAAANARLGGFRGTIGNFNWREFNSGARSASVQMMGLQNAFSGTFQIGSLLRTLLGSLTIGEIGRNFFEATNAAMQFKAGMSVISKEAGFADTQLKYINRTAKSFGQDILGAEEGFMKFAISANKAGATLGQTKNIYEGFSTAMTVLGTSTERQKDVFLALQQVMNKGYLGSEELMQQINEHMPGAIGYLREETKRLGVDLQDALEKKMLNGTQALLYLAKRYRDEFGPSLQEALERPNTQMTILKSNVKELFQQIGEGGANKGFADLLGRINSYMTPERVEKFANIIGGKLAEMTKRAGDAFDWLYQNWDKIKGPLGTTLSLIGKWMVVTGALQIGKALVSPLITAYTAAKMLIPQLTQVRTLMAAMATTSIVSPVAAGGGAALVGPYAALLDVFNKLKMAVASNGGVFGAMRAGFASISGMVPGVVTAIGGIATAIVGGVAGAWAIAGTSARENGIKMASDQYTTGEIIKGIWITVAEKMSGAWDTVTNFLTDKINWVAEKFGVNFSGIGEFAAKTAFVLSYSFTTALEGIMRAVISLAMAIKDTLASPFKAIGQAANGDFKGAASSLGNAVTGKTAIDAFKKGFAGYGDKLSVGGIQKGWNDLGKGAGVVSDWLAGMGAKGRAANNAGAPKPPKLGGDRGTQNIAALYGDGNAADQYDPSRLLQEAKTKKKGRKPKTAEQIEKAAEAAQSRLDGAADNIMRRFAEDNPTLKLTQDFVSDLSAQGRELLNSGAYDKFLANLQKGAKDGTVSVNSLIDALKGQGVETDVLNNLEQRYGITKDQLIQQLKEEGDAYARNLQDLKDKRTFGFEEMKQEQENLTLARLNNREQEIAGKLMEMVNKAKENHVNVTQDMIDARRAELELIQKQNEMLEKQKYLFENNGLRQYIKDSRQTADVVADLDKTTFQGLEDTLYDLGMTGKLSFKNMFASIQSEITRWAASGVTKQLINLIMPGAQQNVASGGSPTLWGGLFGALGHDPNDVKADRERIGEFGGMASYAYDPATRSLRVSVANGLGLPGQVGQGGLEQTASVVGGASGGVGGLVDSNGDLTGDASAQIGAATTGMADMFKSAMFPAIGTIAYGFSTGFKDPIKLVAAFFGQMLIQQLMASQTAGSMGGGGGGGIFGSIFGGIGKLFGGGVGAEPIGAGGLPGIYKEGGIAGSPVTSMSASPAAFRNAPHYKDGTANTSGIPAILHDNEAVIPLSRGRKVPVHLTNGDSQGNSKNINVQFNVTSPDADSFRKSKQQIMTDLHAAAGRAYARNH